MWDPLYFLIVAPAFLLAMWAQWRVKSTYARAQQQGARLSGAAAARQVLDSAGLHQVGIEIIGGELTDHYDPRAKVLRLSQDVYQSRTMAAVGIAAHEAGHAIQDARHYAPLVVRNLAVPAANIGSQASSLLFMLGLVLSYQGLSFGSWLVLGAIIAFGCVVLFQVVNLPVEFDASRRAKLELVNLGIVDAHNMGPVHQVLNAAAMTYVAATLQTILTMVYYIYRYMHSRRDN